MDNKSISIMAALFFLICACPVTAQEFEFVEFMSFNVPGITEISDFDFGDLDGDGFPEILAVSSDSIFLYSSEIDSILLSKDLGLDNFWGNFRFLFADVNRDSIPDIIIGKYSIMENELQIEFFNGADILNGNYLPQIYIYPSSTYWYSPFLNLSILDAMDLNCDGYNEMILSYDSSIIRSIAPVGDGTLTGNTHIYHSFPDSIHINNKLAVTGPVISLSSYGEKIIVRQQYGWFSEIGPDRSVHKSWNTILDATTMTESDYSKILPNVSASYNIRCGNFIDIDSNDEILVRKLIYNSDYDRYDTKMELYGFSDSLSVELIWEQWYGNSISGYIYIPDYPGTFFGNWNGNFTQFDGRNGIVLSVSDSPITADKIFWEYLFDDARPYRVAITSNNVTLYEVKQIPTSVDENGPLPKTFAVGNPYPNPFNASQTIPIKLNRVGERLEVAIFDILGRKIEIIYDNVTTNTEIKITWNADRFASGIYFIKATSENRSEIVKTILLK